MKTAQDLRKKLRETSDKLSMLIDMKTYQEYELNILDLLKLIKEFLNDEEKFQLYNTPFFNNMDTTKKIRIIKLVNNERIQLEMLYDEKLDGKLIKYEVIKIIKQLSDEAKFQILHDKKIIEKYQLEQYDLINIIDTFNYETKLKLLEDNEFVINTLKLDEWRINNLIAQLPNDEVKIKLMEIYQIISYGRINIINTFKQENKIKILLEDKNLNKYDIIEIISTLDINTLISFFKNNRDFCTENNINLYEIIMRLDSERQKGIVEILLRDEELTLSEKKEVFATLKEETKQSIDKTTLPEEYAKAISMQTTPIGIIRNLDFERNLEDYRGLDNLMIINPEQFSEEQRKKFIELYDICPNLQVISCLNNVIEMISTFSEYIEGEKWITAVLNKLKPEYSDAQKIAIIDNEIGKKISYSPDFDTEVFDGNNSRALWKIIVSGYGVCNGIAKVEQYIFARIGIESELVGGENHVFLKLKDIELPFANGETQKGNTIIDPTWNLTSHRFGGRPDNFCISYDQVRKNDIDSNGTDHECHKNDLDLQDATIGLDEQSLRQLFMSVGLADKDGQFPIKELIEKSEMIDEIYNQNPKQNIEKQFFLLYQICPEFATCQNSSICILGDILLNKKNLRFSKCVINRVYAKDDEEKRPIMYVYIESSEIGKMFVYADKEQGQMIQLSQEEFNKRFECYEKDLKKSDGIRPWENKEKSKEKNDLSQNSGTIATGEDER